MITLNAGDADVKVWVECEGKALKEHDVKKKGNVQECWIASEENKVIGDVFMDLVSSNT